MYDTRIPIQKGTEIEYTQSDYKYIFKIGNLIGLGGSCLVYEATYSDESGIKHECFLKQLYPLHTDTENTVPISPKEIERFLRSASIQQQIREHYETVNTTSNIRSVFSFHDSQYFQFTEKQAGATLNKIHFDTIH
ncbi:MAG: hypothetical protein K2G88_01125, partial [Oscillospiraceae bacterium]|nr:hypothetical protein [Oscillospiraceae bacterium]